MYMQVHTIYSYVYAFDCVVMHMADHINIDTGKGLTDSLYSYG